MGQRDATIANDLAEEEVLSLDRRGALVERVDLGVADVLLDRIVLQIAGAAERLQDSVSNWYARSDPTPLTIGSSRSFTRCAVSASAPDTSCATSAF